MRDGWEIKTLGEVCKFVDYRGKTPEKTASGLRLITAKNVKMGFIQRTPEEFVDPKTYSSWMTRGIPKVGDVLFTTEAPLANVAQLDTEEKVVIGQRIITLQPFPDSELDSTFLKYQLLSGNTQERILKKGTGATVQGIKASLLKLIEIYFPPLPEQQRIVSILDEGFEGIATAKENAEKNLQNARAIFESYVESIFTERADGWQRRSLGEIASFRNGVNFTRSSKGASVKIVGVKDFQDNFYSPLVDIDSVTIDGEIPDSDLLRENDILFVRSNGNRELIGRTMLVGSPQEKTTFSGFTIRARLQTTDILPAFLCRYLKSGIVRQEMIDGGNGANISSLNQTVLSELTVPLPPKRQQSSLLVEIEEVDNETQRLESIYQQKLKALDDLKKSLLDQAFSGNL